MMEEFLHLIKSAGAFLKKYRKGINFKIKEEIEVVSEVDILIEEFLKKELTKLYDVKVIGEESFDDGELLPETYWLVDPIDGTLNFLHGLPWVAISIALIQKEEPILGVIYNPFLDECFYAKKGGGAFLNGEKIRVSEEKELSNALLVTSFPGRCKKIGINKCHRLFEIFDEKSRGVRRFGAAALDLAYVACGRFDGFWEPFLKPWDVAAGVLLVKEAGGIVSDYYGNPYNIFKNTLVASNPFLHKEIIEITALIKEFSLF